MKDNFEFRNLIHLEVLIWNIENLQKQDFNHERQFWIPKPNSPQSAYLKYKDLAKTGF